MKTTNNVVLLSLAALLSFMPAAAAAADDETINAQVDRQKEIDDGGSGLYRAIVVSEKSLQHFTVYRPRNVKYAARREGPLPILVWFNGACSGSNTGYERMLNEIASHGYVVVAIGSFRMSDSDDGDGGSSETMFNDAVNWLVRQEKSKTSDYYKSINLKNIAISGHSCGGAQAIANCGNTRVTTLLIMNAGMGGMSMGGASPQSLNSLHCPIIYMTGGTGDVAYENAKVDFGAVKKQAAWADLSNAGHGGTYWDKYGGEFGRIAVKWMDWHMKGYQQNARIFLKPDLSGFSTNWSIKTRNFTAVEKKYDAPYDAFETLTDTIFDREAADSLFDFGADISSLTVLTNQNVTYNGSNGRKKALMPLLKEKGVNSVRLRVLVNPSDNNYNMAYARTLANTARAQGLNIMLDIHYCDWWGDNVKPNAWKNHDLEALLADVTKHTATVVKAINSTGKLRWVQIGNEIDYGLLMERGKQTADIASIINTAYDAVKAVNPDIKTVIHVSECTTTTTLTDFFDALEASGAKWDAIGLSVHVKGSSLKPDQLTTQVADNVTTLKERYGKPVLIVETGYYNDRPLEANQWLCDFLMKLMDAGTTGLYYWEPEFIDDYDFGVFNPRTHKPTIALDAFLGVRHKEIPVAVGSISEDTHSSGAACYTLSGVKVSTPQRGINIIRTADGPTRKIFVR